MKPPAIAAVAALGIALSGCATLVEGTTQSVSVNTTPAQGAQCTLTNSQGTWYLNSPGSVVVHKTKTDLDITCRKPGYAAGHVVATSHLGAMTAGNAALGVGGVVVGMPVDAISGANFYYDNPIEVPLGAPTGETISGNDVTSPFPVSLICSTPDRRPEFAAEGPPGFVTARVQFDINTDENAAAVQVWPGRDAHCTVTAQPGTTLASVSLAVISGESWTANGRPNREIEQHVEIVDSPPVGSSSTGQSHSFTVRARDATQGRITLSVPVRYR